MKNLIKKFSLGVLLCTSLQSFAGDNELTAEKNKSYTKSYSVGSSDKIRLNNKFGDMNIKPWDKNEIKVDVTITVKAGDETTAQDIIDAISIEDGKKNNEIFFETQLKETRKKNRGGGQSMQINYLVYLPSKNTLDITNQFGPINMSDYAGNLYIESKFGSLTAGKLSKPQQISVEFGKANIESLNGGSLTIKFSRAQINNIIGDVKANFEHCNGIKLNLSNDIKSLDLKNNFTTLYLDVASNLSASFDISTHFGKVKNKTSLSIKDELDDEEDGRPGFDNRYRGKAGNGSSDIRIRSEFSTISLVNNYAFDVNEKPKKADKV